MYSISKYIVLFLFSLLWFVGCSADTAKWLFEKGITKDEYRYGDLYRLSNLSQFRQPVDVCNQVFKKHSGNYPANLYLIGDSFTEAGRIESQDFASENFYRFHIADTSEIVLKKEIKNILVIQTVERHFRERFLKPYQNLKINSNQKEKKPENTETTFKIPYDTQRHEAILFASDFMLTIKEWKAWFNWKVFGRIDEKVALSKDGKHLLYGLDVKAGINSCFDKISDDETKLLVKNVNLMDETYKKAGFDEVFLSIIPNKTSIVAPDSGNYNHLIERIQQHPDLKTPIIDIYSVFKNPKNSYNGSFYDLGDTHWNCEGRYQWTNLVNKKIKELMLSK